MLLSTVLTLIIAVALIGTYMRVVARNVSYAYGREIFNPMSYNLGIYMLTGLIGSVAIAVAPKDIQINEMVDSWATASLRWTALALMVYGFMVLAIGARFYRRFLIQDQDQAQARVKQRVLSPLTSRMLTATFLGVILTFTTSRLEFLMSLMTGGLDTWAVMALRAELVETELSTIFIRRVVVEGLIWIYVLYLARTGRYRGQVWLLSACMSVYFLGSLAKIKMVLFLLSLLMCKSWNRHLSLGSVAKVAGIVFLGLIGIWAAFVRNLDPSYLFAIYSEGLVGRILISEISALYPHLAIFGSLENHLGMASVSNLIASVFDLNPMPRSGGIVLGIVSPEWVKAGIGGVFNTVFFGEAFANFGVVGLLLSPLLVLLVYTAIALGARLLPYHLRVAFLVHAALNISVMAGFNDYLWNPFLIVVFAVLLIVSRFNSYLFYAFKPITCRTSTA
ncbi:MAG: hypothetical protein ACKO0Z_23260 [Betaproteobacteria bacterium]